jgi:hypothetical protein
LSQLFGMPRRYCRGGPRFSTASMSLSPGPRTRRGRRGTRRGGRRGAVGVRLSAAPPRGR